MARSVSGEAWFDANASRLVLWLGCLVGLASFGYYYAHGLTTAHYDAKAHLVVARRITDSVQPGYIQMGVHWLPLIHLLYWPLTLVDDQYRSGFLPSLISVFSFALSVWLVFRISRWATGSSAAGFFAGILLLANSNLQYLQSCPLTEPVYLALMLLSLDSLIRWREGKCSALPWTASIWTALAALCRYEGWYYLAGLVLVLVWDFGRRYRPRTHVLKAALLFVGMFGVPVLAHFTYLYVRTGDTFLHRVARGNPAPYETFKRPFLALMYHLGELVQVAGLIPLLLGLVGTLYCLARFRPLNRLAPLFLLWVPSLVNISALYWGMIYRVRYSVLLLPALAIFGSFLLQSETALRRAFVAVSFIAMTLPWLTWYFPHDWKHRFFHPGPGVTFLPAAALICFFLARATTHFRWPLLVLCALGAQIPVLEGEHRPILPETLEHQFIERERQSVLSHLRGNYDGTRILVDMEKMAPLVFDSRIAIREFVYEEGERSHWERALRAPYREVGWLCGLKGDAVWLALQVDPHLADRYSLAVQTENFKLYRLRWEDRGYLLPGRRLE